MKSIVINFYPISITKVVYFLQMYPPYLVSFGELSSGIVEILLPMSNEESELSQFNMLIIRPS